MVINFEIQCKEEFCQDSEENSGFLLLGGTLLCQSFTSTFTFYDNDLSCSSQISESRN